MKFSDHHPEFYSTHIITEKYDEFKGIENTSLSEFLSQFVGYRPQLLNFLRAFLYILFTNNTRYQLAFYFFEPGGTGKSTIIINILIYLLGPEATLSTTLNNLNSRFGLSRITHKLVLNDMTHFKDKEPKLLKEKITGDSLESEKKYKEDINVSPQLIVTITSNSI
jgi:phage/plasmid-associated DNA primase